MRAHKKKIALGVLVSGNGTNLQSIIDAALSRRIDAQVKVVVSDVKEAKALERARKHDIPAVVIDRKTFDSRSAFEQKIVEILKQHGVELVCLAGFMRIIGKTLLNAYPDRIVNIHPALLPSFTGLDAQKQAFEYGVKMTGATVHFVDEKTDHGPIISQTAVEVHEDDTVETLRARILKEEHRIYPEAIQLIAEGRVSLNGRRVHIARQ
jgi:phosphoribosylglycinamide formyltransferase-1